MKAPRTILALPFEDADLTSYLESTYPDAGIETLSKEDIAGLSISSLLRKVREKKKDMIAASLRHSTVKRTTSMTELILSAGRCRSKIYFDSEGKLRVITRYRIFFVILPALAFGSVAGLIVVMMNYLYSLFVTRGGTPKKLATGSIRSGGNILFLRTDLAGELRAGGSVTHIKGVIGAFLKLGYRVTYISDAKSPALPPEVDQVVLSPPRMFDFFDEFQLSAFNFQISMKSGSFIRQYKPALVYQRLSAFNFSGGVIAGRAHVPMVLEANASEVWAKKNWSRLLFERAAVRCESAALHLASRISIVSEVAREQLALYGLPDERFMVVPNGVDPEEFRPSVGGPDIRSRLRLGDSVVVGFIGTFTKWHGVETLYDAAAIAVQRNRGLRFLMIGDGALRPELEKRAREAGISDYFIFTGLVPHSAAPGYLEACDIVVSPHLGFTDGTKFFGSPTKLFEYMAMAKPIIASRLEQIGDIITDGVNGLWMTPGDADELAQKILKLAGDQGLREKLGIEARKECEERYTWKANVERMVERL